MNTQTAERPLYSSTPKPGSISEVGAYLKCKLPYTDRAYLYTRKELDRAINNELTSAEKQVIKTRTERYR
jgi:hypothetical protein